MIIRSSQHITYTPTDETTREKDILKLISSKDITMISSITTIRRDSVKQTKCEQVSDFLVITAPPTKALENPSYNNSALSVNTGKTRVELRYYKK